MGFFSRFKKWMGAETPEEQGARPTASEAVAESVSEPAGIAPETKECEETAASEAGEDAREAEELGTVAEVLPEPMAESVPESVLEEAAPETAAPAPVHPEADVTAALETVSGRESKNTSETGAESAAETSAPETVMETGEAAPDVSPEARETEEAAAPETVEEGPAPNPALESVEEAAPETASAGIAQREEGAVVPGESESVPPAVPESVPERAAEEGPRRKKGWFASLFGGDREEAEDSRHASPAAADAGDGATTLADDAAMTLRLREAEPRLSVWLGIVLDGVDEAGGELWRRLHFLLRSLDVPEGEAEAFVDDFARWLERMEYHRLEEFRSELQYRLALALDMEDEEDERNRLFLKMSDGLARTREQLSRQLNAVFSGHGELTDAFWEELEELFIMADLGYDASMALVERLRRRAAASGIVRADALRAVLRDEIEEIFRVPRRIATFTPPEVVLFIGVNGVGKTTTIAKLAYRARMQGRKVMIAAADTFRAAAIEQLQVWADRVGALFHARPAGSDPASVAFEAMDRALAEQVDILFVDTAGRLQTKHNLMEELAKIRAVLGKKHPGAPHRTVLALDATTGQNALSQAKLFKEAAGVDELILTKMDGTAKGGVAIAVAMQEHLPITYMGFGEKLEDLRPFNGDDYARALLGEKKS